MQRRRPSLHVLLDTVVNAYNEHDLDAMVAWFKSLSFKRWFPRQMGYFMPYHARQQDIENIAAAQPKTDRCPARFTVENGEIIPAVTMTKCELGAPAISPEGDVTICCHDMLHRHRLGNVVEQSSLRNIIASDTFQQAANQGKRMSLDICQGCN
jgi:MoaA/NifB/PqqE/SkfB family radical SAM enzyme